MGFFVSQKKDVRYGALLDIGSGSVLAAIVASDPSKKAPEIIWSKREYTPIKKDTASPNNTKGILTSLMGVMMLLDSQGRQKLYETHKTNDIEFLQVTIAAPWSYTTTKTIVYENKDDFEVSIELVQELLRTAHKKAQEELEEKEKISDYGLAVIAKKTLQITANDYIINVTGKQKAKVLKIVEASSVVQKNLTEAIVEIKGKILPKTTMAQHSFMLPYFHVINSLNETSSEYCLVDITYESTEIGIVRNGVLNYCTHVPYGSYTLAREMADILSITSDEAFGYLGNEDIFSFMQSATETQIKSVEALLEKYQKKLTELFHETGDSLAIPKKIYIHGNLASEPFFNIQVKRAAKVATRLDHAAYNITSELLTKNFADKDTNIALKDQDTALLITAQFFHTKDLHERFDHL